MKELTDQELTNKIRQVFDEFEDPEANQGWEELRKKFPEENKKPVFIWWWSAAALFILCFGIWFLLPEKDQQQQNFVNKPNTFIKRDSLNKHTEISPDQLSADDKSRKQQLSNDNQPINSARNSYNKPAGIPSYSITGIDTVKQMYSEVLPVRAIDSVTENIALTPNAVAENTIAKQQDDVSPSSPIPATDPINKTVELKNPSKDDQKKSSKNTKEKLGLSFFAGSFFNYSEGSDTKLNFGAGISSDVKLSKKLRLTTGLSIAKNSLDYDGGIPTASTSDKAYNSVAPPSALINPAAITLQTITNYNADLLSLDIPVNLKYLIIPEANKLYVSAGLSSGTQINETYVYYYQNYSTASGFSSNRAKGEENKKQFQSFDLARTFNLSFGFSTNLSKHQNITIEPFLKYPLGGLGSENLRFGSSGINLKLNFNRSNNEK